MSIPDEPIRQYFTLLTDLPLAEIDRLLAPGRQSARRQGGPGQDDRRRATVGAGSGGAAASAFRRRTQGEDPDEIPEVGPRRRQLDTEGRIAGPRLIVALGLETSTSNARRVIEGGGVTIGPERQAVDRSQGPDRRCTTG